MYLLTRRLKLSFLSLACLAAVHSVSHAGLFDDEEARKAILDLRQKVEANDQARIRDIQALQAGQAAQTGQTQQAQAAQTAQSAAQQTLLEDNAQMKRSMLALQNQIELLRAEIAKQVGSQEQLAKDVSDIQRRQRDLAQNVDDRMRKLEPVKVNPDGKEFTADPAEIKDYDAALALFRKGDFKVTTQSFVDFLRRYPQSGYQSLGLFWLGNSQYANREYRDAIANFKSSVEANPASSKAPEAMLAMANSQIELKDTRSARRTLDDLIKTYPQSEAAVAAKDRLARLK
jgi:tol-pal system protein YbgF